VVPAGAADQLGPLFSGWNDTTPTARALLDGADPVVEEVTDGWLRARFDDREQLERVRGLGVRSCLYIPLRLEDRVLGALVLLALDPARGTHTPADVALGRRVALIAAGALRNASLLEALRRELADRRRLADTLRASVDREAGRARERQALMNAIPAGVWIVDDVRGVSVRCNDEAYRQMRLPLPEGTPHVYHLAPKAFPSVFIDGQPVPQEDHPLYRAAREGRAFTGVESEWVYPDGTRAHHMFNVTPLLDADGRPKGAIKVALDITQLKETEAALRHHREELEQLVEERTRALEQTYERLLHAERLATIGTLSAGLGHDMGNLLLPLRLRLDSLNSMSLPVEAGQDLKAIADVVAYLQRLTSGLRLLAGDPKSETGAPVPTRIAGWWREVEPLLRDATPAGVVLIHEFSSNLPPVRIPPSALTQVVFNLVQNAGHAMQGQPGGRVVIRVKPDGRRRAVSFTVEDNGPGMDAEQLRRCFEPYFSTKKRQISTGLGLPLVRALLEHVGGRITVNSTLGAGATFEFSVPVTEARARRASTPRAARVARVTVRDPRMRALLTSVLTNDGFFVGDTANLLQGQGQVWVTDRESLDDPQKLLEFVAAGSDRIGLVVNVASFPLTHPRVHVLESGTQVGRLRELLSGGQADDAPRPKPQRSRRR
jgi:signal transduction histidine kinase